MSTEIEARKASEQNFAAMNRMLNGDAAPLADIWSHSTVALRLNRRSTSSFQQAQ
jgi:hypothetical protein